ncbi:TPA: hypothetical protein QEL15_004309 [Stenotrophomonas maltophilia]|nr:hypothetical protein [Stenotrophomonas maltophilia]
MNKILLASFFVLALAGCRKEITYPDQWSYGDGPAFGKIANTLARNGISGCGEFWYKLENGEDRGIAVVYCLSRSPFSFKEYTVFYEVEKVSRGSDYRGPLPKIDQ